MASEEPPTAHDPLCEEMVARPRFLTLNEAPAAASLVHYYLLWEMVTRPRFPILNELAPPLRRGSAAPPPPAGRSERFSPAARTAPHRTGRF